jgi:hypothetical protein
MFNKQILIRVTEDQNSQIDHLLNTFDRQTYPTKADLIRRLLTLGLEQMNATTK